MYDYIIIGAGSAGCILANRLSADPAVRVLLLEAGGRGRHPNLHIPGAYGELHRSKNDWGFSTEPQEHLLGRRLYLPRGKGLGGSSSTNAMAYVRGNRSDYDEWSSLGNAGWAYEQVLPYFIHSENNQQLAELDAGFHGGAGELQVADPLFTTPIGHAYVAAGEQIGLPRKRDYNGQDQTGVGHFQFTIKAGRRHSAATAFLKPILHRSNLVVVTGAHVQRIQLRNDRVVAVDYRRGKSNGRAEVSREVILSAGAFQSPQLLMLSGIGDAEQLRRHGIKCLKELPGVGQNLQDHLFYPIAGFLKQQQGVNHYLKPWQKAKALGQYFSGRRGPFVASPLEAFAFFQLAQDGSFRGSPGRGRAGGQPICEQDTPGAQESGRVNMQFHFAPLHSGREYWRDFYNLKHFVTEDGFSLLPSLLKPKSRGYVALRSADPQDVPCIQPNFLADDDDLKLLMAAGKVALELVGQSEFSRHVKELYFPPDASDDALRDVLLNRLETIYHPVGTCKMGTDEMAVVDAELRVHGIEGLRVIDASIMPTIVAGNTNAPVMMIAEKGAAMIVAGSRSCPR